MTLLLKRAYEKPAEGDGFRVLVDRLWPRGLTHQQIDINLWLKPVAPSAALRQWFNHEPEKWAVFGDRYIEELMQHNEAVQVLIQHALHDDVTLVYAAKDTVHTHARVLRDFLQRYHGL